MPASIRTSLSWREPTPGRSRVLISAAIARGQGCVEAGAEGFFADGLLSVEELRRVAQEVPAPYRLVNIGGSAKKRTTPKIPLPELKSMGYNCALFGLQLVRASTLAMLRFLESLRTVGIDADIELIRQLEGTCRWKSGTNLPGSARSARWKNAIRQAKKSLPAASRAAWLL